jgi:gliding motility-associated protein GldL
MMGFHKKTMNFIEKFLSGEKGRRFFQIFYNLGAAIVVIGALAKINHWPYGLGSILLAVGLITEFFVFFISAFDRPAKEYEWDKVFPVLDNEEESRPSFGGGGGGGGYAGGSGSGSGSGEYKGTASGGSGGGGGTVIIGGGGMADGVTMEGGMAPGAMGSGGPVILGGGGGGGGYYGGGSGSGEGGGPKSSVEAVEGMTTGQIRQSFGIPNAVELSEEDTNALTSSIKKMAAAADQLGKMAEMTEATQVYLDQVTAMSEDMKKFSDVTNSLTDVSDILLNSYKSITDNSDGINQSSRGYVHQMENLNRNIQGLNTIYEIQLKSVSSQIDAIERINAGLMRIKDLYEGSIVDSSVFRSETEKMAQQLHALNGVYNRLLNAMTMNMYGSGTAGGFNPPPGFNPGAGFNPQDNP